MVGPVEIPDRHGLAGLVAEPQVRFVTDEQFEDAEDALRVPSFMFRPCDGQIAFSDHLERARGVYAAEIVGTVEHGHAWPFPLAEGLS